MPEAPDMTEEVLRQAVVNVVLRMHGPGVVVDLDGSVQFFRQMVDEVRRLDDASQAIRKVFE